MTMLRVSCPDMSRSSASTQTKGWATAALVLTAALMPVTASIAPTSALAAQTDARKAPTSAINVETVASGLAYPWGLEFLNDGRFLVTERPGKLKIVSADGASMTEVTGLPTVRARGQGGLLDVTVAPDFSETGTLYLSFSEPAGNGGARTSVAKANLEIAPDGSAKLTDTKIIFQQDPVVRSSHHFGSRVVVAPDGSLFITTGDRGSERQSAQDPGNTIGVVVRINPDGTPHADNPNKPGWKPEIYSIGHRNIQGADIDPATGQLWTVEHGARGGDELNKPEPGKNYGWPTITYGRDYSGMRIGIGQEKAGLEQPVYYWVPSIATSGLQFVSGKRFTDWKGNILVGGLSGSRLSRLVLADDKTSVASEEILLSGEGLRIREVREGPDGVIYILIDERDGSLMRLTPGKSS